MFREKYKWVNPSEHSIETKEELLTTLLKNRSIDDKEVFLSGDGTLHSPFLFRDMKRVVERIQRAVLNQEEVIIYGDYDVDGVTGTAILVRTLRRLGLEPSFYIPNRFTEGYGPNKRAFTEFANYGFSLVITVDNGISGDEEAKILKDAGVDLIITDHHEVKEIIPEAYAIIHPKLEGETYPFSDLSGCGVAFKLACALLEDEGEDLVDLASLGTYADIVSSLGENRVILKRGIRQLAKTTHEGLIALRQVAKIESIDEFALGFLYGPRLNAPGRMESAQEAVELLITDDPDEAHELALRVDELNTQRKHVIEETFEEAKAMIIEEGLLHDRVLVLKKEHWHEGILGIIAARLVETYGKPAIVLTTCEQGYKGSARTLPDFPLFANLQEVSSFLLTFGGHHMAAGLTLACENYEGFKKALNALANSDMEQELLVEGVLAGKVIDEKLVLLQEQLRPYGPGNPEPHYLFEGAVVQSVSTVGQGGKHLRLTVDYDGLKLSCIGFNLGFYAKEMAVEDRIDLVGTLNLNTYLNKITVQVQLKDLRCKDIQLFDFRTKYFNPEILRELDVQPIYFENAYGISLAVKYYEIEDFKENILLVDLPSKLTDLRPIVHSKLSKLMVLFRSQDLFSEEQLFTRSHFAKAYTIYRKFKNFSMDDPKLVHFFERSGLTKKLHTAAIQVFFELNFVIIRGKSVEVVEDPIKRDLKESPTFQDLTERTRLKEKLTLSSTDELRAFLFNDQIDF